MREHCGTVGARYLVPKTVDDETLPADHGLGGKVRSSTTSGADAGGGITLPKRPTGAPTFPRGATGGWTIERKAPAPPPAAPLTWTTKGGAR